MDQEDPGIVLRERERERETERDRERERERDNIYIYFCTCINPSYLQREYCWVFVGIGSVYSPQWYYSVA